MQADATAIRATSIIPAQRPSQIPDPFAPVIARTQALRMPQLPVAHDCMKLIFVRSGSAMLLGEFGELPVKLGDAVALGANTLCGSEPEGSITVTTLCLDRDFVIDQVFWQHSAFLADRWEAQDLADELYSEPAQILRLGEDRAKRMVPWLDELVALSLDRPSPAKFYRLQALLFAVLDVIMPFVRTTPVRHSPTQRTVTRPGPSSPLRCAPLRTEARQAADLFHTRPEHRWTLHEIAAAVHLSPSQIGRVFVDAYGKTPMTYLATVRAEHLARLLRDTNLPIEPAMRQVGWHSRGHAARVFRQVVGVRDRANRSLVVGVGVALT